MNSKLQTKIIAAAAALMLVGSSGAMAAVLYDQPTDSNGAFSSQNDTSGGNGNFATVYDNFTLGATSNVANVMFTGSYFNPPTQGTITAFTIVFYADAVGMPGAMLQSYNMAGAANETSLGNDNFGDPLFSYSFDLSSAFNAIAGTQYWMSIVPDLGFPPQWGWETGTGGDGTSYQDFFGVRGQLAGDLAFTLNGAPAGVPDSGTTVLLLGCGLIVLGLLQRRKLAMS